MFIKKKYHIKTEIIINCSVERVWSELMDFEQYHRWNPFIPQISGEKEIGARLRIAIHPVDLPPQNYTVKLTALENQKKFNWLGHFHIPFLIDGDHRFEMSSLAPKQTLFTHEEFFRGLLVPFVWSSFIEKRLKPRFQELNEKLKLRLESGTPTETETKA